MKHSRVGRSRLELVRYLGGRSVPSWDARRLRDIEHRLMLQMAPDFQLLTLMQKVEVFQACLLRTTGEDLAKVLWLNSQTSEMWLRCNSCQSESGHKFAEEINKG